MARKNKFLWGIFAIGTLEIIIGATTLVAVIISLLLGASTKPFGVLVFICVSAIASFILGLGIWAYNRKAYNLLLYFASLIIFSKILIFLKIIYLSGALETNIPAALKNTISLIYHAWIIWYLNQKPVKNYFLPQRNAA